ncbi:Maf family protein [Alteromonas sp. a30]|uniref:Maf family protein n=1 Tax=Alteromonas sp. a30 TaxID=2730917 RepID=UPI00227FA40F|nr:Maf family protein [Alteromonas sp. a30]MCY7295258.1 septum formation inhibitor Maf [Alteromonas sp. a30]
MSPQLILASQSPRRAELLNQVGVNFITCPADVDETPLEDEPPLQYVLRMAKLKSETVWNQQQASQSNSECVVLGSDTIGEINGQVLVKPQDLNDFLQMQQLMSNTTHYVHTSIAVSTPTGTFAEVVTTEVEFGVISEADSHWYWQTGEPQDKAGGYAIQGLGGQFVKQIKGSYSAVVGLPLYETVRLLKHTGITPHER